MSLEGVLTASVLVPFRTPPASAPCGGRRPCVACPSPGRKRRRAGKRPSSPCTPRPVLPLRRAGLPPGAPRASSGSPARSSADPRPAARPTCGAQGCSRGVAAGGQMFQRTARLGTAAQRPTARPRSSCHVGVPGRPRRGWKERSQGRGASPCPSGERAAPGDGASWTAASSRLAPWAPRANL